MDFLGKCFGKKYKHTELALNFFQKKQGNTFSLHFSPVGIS